MLVPLLPGPWSLSLYHPALCHVAPGPVCSISLQFCSMPRQASLRLQDGHLKDVARSLLSVNYLGRWSTPDTCRHQERTHILIHMHTEAHTHTHTCRNTSTLTLEHMCTLACMCTHCTCTVTLAHMLYKWRCEQTPSLGPRFHFTLVLCCDLGPIPLSLASVSKPSS